MKNLHDINTNIIAWMWFVTTGRNGRHAEGGVEHLYPTPRGTPTPIGNQTRRWWTPYTTSPEFGVTPNLCGHQVQTRARRPYLRQGNGHTTCLNCLEIAEQRNLRTGTYWQTVQRDPFSQLDWGVRATTPDPITGL